MSRKFKVKFCGFNVINVYHVVIPQTHKNNTRQVWSQLLILEDNA